MKNNKLPFTGRDIFLNEKDDQDDAFGAIVKEHIKKPEVVKPVAKTRKKKK